MLTYWTPVTGVLFGFVTVPKTSMWQCLFADITYETSTAWVLLLPPSWPGMGSIKCLSTRQRGQSTGPGTGTIPCGCCHALLNMYFTSSILNCQCIFLLAEYFLWRMCALSITILAMHKEFLWPIDTFTQKTVVL